MKHLRNWIAGSLVCLLLAQTAGAAAQGSPEEAAVVPPQTPQYCEADAHELVSAAEIRQNGYVRRLREEETLYSLVFEDADGVRTEYIYGIPAKYVAEDGQIRDKSNTLTALPAAQNAGAYALASTGNDMQTYFPAAVTETAPVVLERGAMRIEMAPLEAAPAPVEPHAALAAALPGLAAVPVEARTAAVQQVAPADAPAAQAAQYDGVFGPGTGLRYTPMYNGVKEDIVLTKYNGLSVFRFSLDLGGLVPVREGGGYALLDAQTQEAVANLQPILVCDSAQRGSLNNSMELTHISGTRYTLTITADDAFLRDPQTVYPVYIDPTITTPTSVFRDTTIYSTYQAAPDSNLLMVGNSAVYGYSTGVGRSLVRFNGIFESGQYSWARSATQRVYYYVRDLLPGMSSADVQAFCLSQSAGKNLTSLSTSTWSATGDLVSNMATPSAPELGGRAGDWKRFNLTSAFSKWLGGQYGGENNHYGIMLKATNEANARAFASADYGIAEYLPYLRIDFNTNGTQTPGIISGGVYYLQNLDSALYAKTNGTANNSALVQAAFANNATNELYRFLYKGSGVYAIEPVNAPGKVVSVDSVEKGSYGGRAVGIYTDYGIDRQRWYIRGGNNAYYFVNKAYPTQILSANASSASGAALYISSSGNGGQWTLKNYYATVGWSYMFRGSNPSTNVTSSYGYRKDPMTGEENVFHKGVDISAAGGTPLYSVTSGRVVKKGYEANNLGHYIILETNTMNAGTSTKLRVLYAHMQAASTLSVGDSVTASTVVGKVGRTGRATGDHVHFVVITDGKDDSSAENTLNPVVFFPNYLPQEPHNL